MKKEILIFFFFLASFLLTGCSLPINFAPAESGQTATKPQEEKVASPTPLPTLLARPTMQVDSKKEYFALINTDFGTVKIRLNAQQTPITVSNFIYLAENHFYDQTIFHRVVKNFMIQGGDPKGDGTGGPGYFFNDEPFEGGYERGTVAMANAGPDTNGSQFFIMHQDYQLPKNYVIFGKVVSGIEVVDKIATAPLEINAFGEGSKPVSPVVINSVEIIEK